MQNSMTNWKRKINYECDRGEISEVINKLSLERELNHLKSAYDLQLKILEVNSDVKAFSTIESQRNTDTCKKIFELSSLLEEKSEKDKDKLNNLQTKINMFVFIIFVLLAAIILYVIFKP